MSLRSLIKFSLVGLAQNGRAPNLPATSRRVYSPGLHSLGFTTATRWCGQRHSNFQQRFCRRRL